jgi:phosphomannomutase
MLAGQQVSVADLAYGTDQLPGTDAVLITGETMKVVVRPSGTEPKLKWYLETRLPAAPCADLAAARKEARSMLATISAEMSAALGF